MSEAALWECPECGAKLVARNLSHACGAYSVDAFLEGRSACARELFERFRAAVAACGPYGVAPAKTRVAFMARVRFASVNRLSVDSIHVHFVLPRAIASERIARVERVGRVYVHHLRLSRDEDFDGELVGWLREAYEQYGEQRWRRSKAGARKR